MCVIFNYRCCVCWIDDGTLTTCGYRIPGVPLRKYCNCRRFQFLAFVRFIKFNYRFSCQYISLMSHWWTIASQPFFLFLYVPNVFLTTFPKAPQFISHHLLSKIQLSYIYIYICCRREGGIGEHDKVCFHFGERFYVWEWPIFENIGDGKSNDYFWKKKNQKKQIVHP
jgi:hypothetical protein